MPAFDIAMASCSEPGQRDANEDALCTGQVEVDRHATNYAVLADGAGGHERGAEAARRVVEGVEAGLRLGQGQGQTAFAPAGLSGVLRAVHAELQQLQDGAQGRARMHATVVVLWLDTAHDRALWSHVGDSRLFRLRYGAVDRVTADDSVVQRLLERGVLTTEQAQTHPLKSQLLAAMGMQDSVEPHTIDTPQRLEDGDAFLLCSDGWWGALSDAELAATLADADTPQAWLDAMRRLILARATPRQDNFSAIAVWVSDPLESTRSMAD